MTENYTLLPSGFHDVLPPFAQEESRIVHHLNSFFARYGYQHIKPPMVEFGNSFQDDTHRDFDGKSFKLLDPISQKMMQVRADMTLQASRIASLRLKDEPRPLRLSYSGQVLRVKGSGLNAERQISQAGAELIGINSQVADGEIISLALNALQSLAYTSLSIDFTLPNLSHTILEHFNTPKALYSKILGLIENKDFSTLKTIDDAAIPTITAILKHSGTVEKSLPALLALDLTEEFNNIIATLASTIDSLQKKYENLAITVDLLERRGFEYHSGIGFSIFSTDSQEELGRGGRYFTLNNEDAIGFTLNVNVLLRTCKHSKKHPTILVPQDTDAASISSLHERGYVTVFHITDSPLREAAQHLRYDYVFIEGKISIA